MKFYNMNVSAHNKLMEKGETFSQKEKNLPKRIHKFKVIRIGA